MCPQRFLSLQKKIKIMKYVKHLLLSFLSFLSMNIGAAEMPIHIQDKIISDQELKKMSNVFFYFIRKKYDKDYITVKKYYLKGLYVDKNKKIFLVKYKKNDLDTFKKNLKLFSKGKNCVRYADNRFSKNVFDDDRGLNLFDYIFTKEVEDCSINNAYEIITHKRLPYYYNQTEGDVFKLKALAKMYSLFI